MAIAAVVFPVIDGAAGVLAGVPSGDAFVATAAVAGEVAAAGASGAAVLATVSGAVVPVGTVSAGALDEHFGAFEAPLSSATPG